MKKVLVFFFIMILANVCIEAQKSPLHYYTIKASQYNSGDLSGLTLNNSDVTKKWTLYSSQYLVTSLKLNGCVFNFNGTSSLYDELPGSYYPTPYSSTDSIIAYNGWYDGDYYKGANLLQFVDFHQLGSDCYSSLMVQYKSGNIWKDGYYLKGSSLSKNSFTLSDTALAKSRPDCFDKSTTFRIVKYPQSGKGDYWPMVSNELSFLFYGQPEMDLAGSNVVCENEQVEFKGYYAKDNNKEYCRINARLMVAISNPGDTSSYKMISNFNKTLNSDTYFSYSDIFGTDSTHFGQQIFLRPVRQLGKNYWGDNYVAIAFLPKANISFSYDNLNCYRDTLKSLTLTCQHLFSGGASNPNTGDSIPLLITIYHYDVKPSAPGGDIGYDSINYRGKYYYYQNGITINNISISNSNKKCLNTSKLFPLTSGIYRVETRFDISTANCPAIDTLFIRQPDEFIPFASAKTLYSKNGTTWNIKTGDSIGTIKIKFTGGTPNYTYMIGEETTFTANNKDTIYYLPTQKDPSKNYIITLKDAHNCKTQQNTITLKRPSDVTLALTPKNVSCNPEDTVGLNKADFTKDGEIKFTISGGVAPYKVFLKQNGNTIASSIMQNEGYSSFTKNESVSIPANRYIVEVVDSLSKDKIWAKDTFVDIPQAINFNATVNNPVCYGGENGSIKNISVSGGTGNLTISINNNSVKDSITGLSKGLYSFLVVDSNTCFHSFTENLSNPDSLILMNDSIKPASCNEASNGKLVVKLKNSKNENNVIFMDNKINLNYTKNNSDTTYILKNLKNKKYSIILNDGNSCITHDTVSIPLRNPGLSLSAQTTDSAPCMGKYGEVTLTAANGEGNYKFTVDGNNYTAQTTATKTFSLKSGVNHTFNVSDGTCNYPIANGTVDIIPNTIALNAISPSDISPAHCASSSTGEIKVSRKKGTGVGETTTYSIFPNISNSSNGTFTGLPVGKYVVAAQDDSLCEAKSDSVTVPVSPNALALTCDNVKPAACAKSSPTGKLKAMSNGTGFGTISFYIDQSTIPHEGTDYLFEGLISGDHTLFARDTSQCTAQIIGTVDSASNPVSLIPLVTDQTCNETSDAQIKISATTQTAGTAQLFQYEFGRKKTGWIADTIYHVGKKGSYTINVTDKDNCGTSADIVVDSLGYKPMLQMDHADSVACLKPLHPNGKLWMYLKSNHSQPPYTYRMFGKDSIQADSASTLVPFDSLALGTYKVRVQDKLGCRDSGQFTVPVTVNPVHITEIDTTSSSCVAAANGKAKITAASYKTDAPYTFVCNKNRMNGNGVIFTGLPVNSNGNYNVTVNDKYGCSYDSSFVIRVRVDTLLLACEGKTDAACPGSSDGMVHLIRHHGNPDYVFNITNGAAFEKNVAGTDTSIWITGLPADTYRVSIADGNHCRSVVSNITVNQHDTIRFWKNEWNYIKRKGDSDGYARAEVWKGNNKYNYRWFSMPDSSLIALGKSFPGDTMEITGLKAGHYLLQVRDTANCYVLPHGWLEKEYSIAEPDTALNLVLVKNRAVSCNGFSDGQFTVKALGGWHKGNNYLYGSDLNSLSSEPTFSNIKAGTKTVIAKDTAGVTVTLPVTTLQPDVLSAALDSSKDANCYGSKDGSIKLNISGGNNPYYKVSVDSSAWLSGSSLIGLKSNIYTAYVKDTLGCHTSVKGIFIGQPADIILLASQVKESRCGFNNGHISATIGGGIPAYHYQWSSPDYSFANVDTGYLSKIISGNYKLTVTDTHFCPKAFMFYVSDSTNLTIDTVQTASVSCWGYSDGGAFIKLSKGNPPYGITWPDSTHDQSVANLAAGLYIVRVSDIDRCKVFKDFAIGTPDSISLQSFTVTDPLCVGVPDGKISIIPTGSFGGYSYLWNNGENRSVIKNLSPGSYHVHVTDAHLCFNDFSFKLNNQQFIHPSLGRDLSLCTGNSAVVAPGRYAAYQWGSDNRLSSTDSSIVVSKPGNYYVQVKDDEGCIGRDTLAVTQSATKLEGKLLVSTDVSQLDTVMVFETSWPVPDSVKFDLPGSRMISYGSYYREVVYPDSGTFKVGLTAYLNDCWDSVHQTIKVGPREAPATKSARFSAFGQIKVWPNPNDGHFRVDVAMNSKSLLLVKLANLSSGVIIDERQLKGSDRYTLNYSLNLMPGTYLLYFQCGNEAKTKKIIVI